MRTVRTMRAVGTVGTVTGVGTMRIMRAVGTVGAMIAVRRMGAVRAVGTMRAVRTVGAVGAVGSMRATGGNVTGIHQSSQAHTGRQNGQTCFKNALAADFSVFARQKIPDFFFKIWKSFSHLKYINYFLPFFFISLISGVSHF